MGIMGDLERSSSSSTSVDTPSSSSFSFSNLSVQDLSFTIHPHHTHLNPFKSPTKPIPVLDSVSFTANSSELLAIVGPSGAGKSTLLRLISGRLPASQYNNNCLFNGLPVTTPARLRNLCGFVTQDDNLLPLLTVKETLMFTANFRLQGLSRRQTEHKIDALILELGLSHIAHSFVGDGDRRGISGGERKRVSIGVDVIHDPPVLLLDEPTSGLDSSSALQVVELLTSMARARQQILIMTIHQPSYRILNYISNYLLLSRGRVAHFGTLTSLDDTISELGYRTPTQLSPLDFAMEITTQLEDHHAKKNNTTTKTLVNLDDDDDDQNLNSYTSRTTEILLLSGRFWKIMYRTKELFLARTVQAIVGGLCLGSVFVNVSSSQDGVAERLGFFAFSLSFLLSSTVEALPIFLQERRVLMRESSRGMYRLSSYMLANTLVYTPLLLVVALLFAVPVYWLVGLNPSLHVFAFFVLIVWMIVTMASSLVLFLSAISPDFILGNSLICVFLAVFFLFSGYFIPRESIPKYWLFMYYVSIYRYPLDSMLVNEYWSVQGRCFSWGSGDQECLLTGGDVLKNRGLERDTRWINVGIMCAFFLIYRVLCWIVLVRRASRTKL